MGALGDAIGRNGGRAPAAPAAAAPTPRAPDAGASQAPPTLAAARRGAALGACAAAATRSPSRSRSCTGTSADSPTRWRFATTSGSTCSCAAQRCCRNVTPSSRRSSGCCAWRGRGPSATAGRCGAPHSRGAVYCWQCGAALMERAEQPGTAGESTRWTWTRCSAGGGRRAGASGRAPCSAASAARRSLPTSATALSAALAPARGRRCSWRCCAASAPYARPSATSGPRRRPLPRRPRAGILGLPSPRVAAVLVLGFLGFGVLLGAGAASRAPDTLAAASRRPLKLLVARSAAASPASTVAVPAGRRCRRGTAGERTGSDTRTRRSRVVPVGRARRAPAHPRAPAPVKAPARAAAQAPAPVAARRGAARRRARLPRSSRRSSTCS